MTYAAETASASALLHQHGVAIFIGLYSCKEKITAPPPAFIQLLAPFLTKIDLYSVATTQTVSSQQMWLQCSASTSAHITALQSCSSSLTALCLSDQKLTLGHGTLLAHSIPALAHLSGLTKLHLSLATSNFVADFQPLSQMRALKDIACSAAEVQHHAQMSSLHAVRTCAWLPLLLAAGAQPLTMPLVRSLSLKGLLSSCQVLTWSKHGDFHA